MTKPQSRVFSGVQPTGNLHLGNYLGAITRFVDMQESHDCIYCVVDLHAITVNYDPAAFQKERLEAAKVLAGKGARVLLGCRSRDKAEAARDRILAAHPDLEEALRTWLLSRH